MQFGPGSITKVGRCGRPQAWVQLFAWSPVAIDRDSLSEGGKECRLPDVFT